MDEKEWILFPGKAAFELHSTYGFPIELVIEMAREQGMVVDVAEFKRLMEEHKAKSRRGMFKDRLQKGQDT